MLGFLLAAFKERNDRAELPLDENQVRRFQPCCYDCGRQYGDEFGFPDLILPDEVWQAIAPDGHGHGILCPSCICRRLHLAGIQTTGFFASGPLQVVRPADQIY